MSIRILAGTLALGAAVGIAVPAVAANKLTVLLDWFVNPDHAPLFVAKERGLPVLLVGHVTKDGSIAGPRMLEHLVDVVCSFEGDRQTSLRFVRALKNRFGPTDEVGCFEMTGDGIAEVPQKIRDFRPGKTLERVGCGQRHPPLRRDLLEVIIRPAVAGLIDRLQFS